MARRTISRRGLLASGTAMVVLAGGGAVALRLGPPAPGARVLTAHELAIVAAAAGVLFPGAPFPLDGVEAGVPLEVDRIVADLMDRARATAFRYVLRTLELGTLASRGQVFTALPAEERADVLQTWSGPGLQPRRLAEDSLEAVLGMAYFAHPAVLGAIGWRATCGAP